VAPKIAREHLIKYVPPEIPGDLILNGSTVVKLKVVIANDGSLSSAKVLEGHVILYCAALRAEAVEVQTICSQRPPHRS
jgi:hypothetical protein